MRDGFDWEESYQAFVDYDFINWQEMVSHMPLPEQVLINADQNSSEQHRTLAIALSEKLGWPIYGISENLNTVPIHYIVKAPGGEYFVDVSGLRPKQYFERYWQKYLATDKVSIVPVTILGRINNDDVSKLASNIYDKIMERYCFD